MLRSFRWAALATVALSCSAAALGLAACNSFGSPEGADADASSSEDGPTSIDGSAQDALLPDAPDPDPDAGAGIEAGPCNGLAACDRFVFVTSNTYTGEDLGGAIAADGKCTVLASLAEASPVLRGRTFRAWMSDDIDNTQPVNRMTHGTRPYRLEDGALIANDWNQLVSGAGLLHAINRDEKGATVGATRAWTGTTAFGLRTLATCTSWTIGGTNGTFGNTSATDSTWTNSGKEVCSTGLRLYCIEQ